MDSILQEIVPGTYIPVGNVVEVKMISFNDLKENTITLFPSYYQVTVRYTDGRVYKYEVVDDPTDSVREFVDFSNKFKTKLEQAKHQKYLQTMEITATFLDTFIQARKEGKITDDQFELYFQQVLTESNRALNDSDQVKKETKEEKQPEPAPVKNSPTEKEEKPKPDKDLPKEEEEEEELVRKSGVTIQDDAHDD